MYTKHKINDFTTLITDRYQEALILIEGEERALLIDTGMDDHNLAEYVKNITDKPIVVGLTHGHIDHIGRTGDFNEVYMNQLDKYVYLQHINMDRGHFNGRDLNFMNVNDIHDMPDCFELGNLKIQVLNLEGHTPGSVIFIDSKNKCVYTGDAVGSGCGVWLQLPESLNMSCYLKALKRVIKKLEDMGVDDTWNFIGGHYGQEHESLVSDYNKLNFSLVKDLYDLTYKLLNKQIEYKKTDAMAFDYKPYYVSYQKAEMIIIKEKVL